MQDRHGDGLRRGHRLGPYEIERELGQGGFGVTYLAKDLNLHRPVAIKEFFPRRWVTRDRRWNVVAMDRYHDEFSAWLGKFKKEAQVLAGFRHPSVVPVFSYFTKHGTGYIVMEFIDGESLFARLERGTLDESELHRHVLPVMDGLEAVHAKGILHRDIKPGNIVLRTDGSPVLVDFGSARQADVAASGDATAVFTRGYAPPEQLAGHGQYQASDIYSLGAVLYHCVTGKVPNPPNGPRARLARLHGYSASLIRGIEVALAVQVENRPRSVAEWKVVLRDVHANEKGGTSGITSTGHACGAKHASGVAQIIEGLNDRQQEAVTAPLGNLLVVAGAGSGKTKVLGHRIAWLLEAEGVSPRSVIAVTFTNKAAAEMQERAERLLNRSVRTMWTGTFFGIALRLLRVNSREAGLPDNFQILDADDQVRLVKRVMRSMDLDEKSWPPRQAAWFINAQKGEGLRAGDLPLSDDASVVTHKKVYEAYEELCRQGGLVDFAELLLRSYELWRDNAELLDHYQRRFRHLLVDEFQDTNAIQYRWLKALAGRGGYMMAVGDDDQSIYGWRGAKIENIHAYTEDLADVRVIRLEQNYRSTGTILKAANGLIDNNMGRLGKELWTAANQGDPILVYSAFNDLEEARFIADRAQSWIDGGASPTEVAVLYRSNAQSRVIEEAFRRRRIPYRIYGTGFAERVMPDQAAPEGGDHPQDSPAVQMMTLHSAKGLEFPLVFMAGMEEGLFPNMRSAEEPGRMEEERRLAYVGITRAMKQLYLTYAESRRMRELETHNRPSRFLQELPKETLDEVHLRGATERPSGSGAARGRVLAGVAASGIRIGALVRHAKFGEGVVLQSEGSGDRTRVQVNFGSHVGAKWLMLSYARLAIVDSHDGD